MLEKEDFRIRELIYFLPPLHRTLLTTIYEGCVYEPVLAVIEEANIQQQGRKRRGNHKGAAYFDVMTLYFPSQQILKHLLAAGVVIITRWVHRV